MKEFLTLFIITIVMCTAGAVTYRFVKKTLEIKASCRRCAPLQENTKVEPMKEHEEKK